MCINASWGSIHNGTCFLVLSDKAKSNGHILTIETYEISSEHKRSLFSCFNFYLFINHVL